ncbi:MAG: toll/interleukin-1 receptor domain-containing protein [Clostridium sp.]|nr:MAG: toll/interleukin-1 receptor domain-containing protein [Clostridium sp.]
MTLPSVDNEKNFLNLYNRANNLRLSNEFDKAYGVYETILEIDENQLEAHWGLILCRYGVEYVDDPKTKKKMITCHRTKYESVLTDPDYKIIISKAYGEALNIYKEEAKTISNIQKKALEISNNEEDYDIFICYKEGDINGDRTTDSVIAQDIYNKLTDLNYKVFFARITLADKLGEEYEPYIFSALNSSKVMLVVGTNADNLNSVWVKNEWSRYLDLIKNKKKKVLIPVYSKMDAYELPEEFSMLQALCIDKVGSMQDLITAVGKIINKKSTDIDSDMYQKFKQMMLEEEREKQEELSKKI